MNDRERQIRDRAYALWESEGGVHARHEDHWRQAEQEIDGSNTSASSDVLKPSQLDMESLPLSDVVGTDSKIQGIPPARMGRAKNPKKLVEAADSGNPIHHTGEQPFDPLTK